MELQSGVKIPTNAGAQTYEHLVHRQWMC